LFKEKSPRVTFEDQKFYKYSRGGTELILSPKPKKHPQNKNSFNNSHNKPSLKKYEILKPKPKPIKNNHQTPKKKEFRALVIDLQSETEHDYHHENQKLYMAEPEGNTDLSKSEESQNLTQINRNDKSKTEFLCSEHIDKSSQQEASSIILDKLQQNFHNSCDQIYENKHLSQNSFNQPESIIEEVAEELLTKVYQEEMCNIIEQWVIANLESSGKRQDSKAWYLDDEYDLSMHTPDISDKSIAELSSFLSIQDGPALMYPRNNIKFFDYDSDSDCE